MRGIRLFIAVSVLIPLVVVAAAVGLVASQKPSPRVEGSAHGGDGHGLSFAGLTLASNPAPLKAFVTRDGSFISLRHYPTSSGKAPLLILLHGSGWHGLQYDSLGKSLSEAGLAEVLAPDLRGHGPHPGRRGDADHIGQIEQDIADLILAHRREGQEVILGGMSLGGGTVIRFAAGPYGEMIDRALLLAPFLYHDAPTTRPGSGGWAHPLTRRIIGLTILNRFQITALNHSTVLQFAFPRFVLDGPAGDTVTPDYSWTLYHALIPRADWRADLASLPPFLLIAGDNDEAFISEAYEKVISAETRVGQYHVIPGLGHLPVVDAPETFDLLSQWLSISAFAQPH